MNTKLKGSLVILLSAIGLVAVFHAPLRWTAKKIQRSTAPELLPERPVYDDTAKAPVDLAAFVRDARRAWPKADLAAVRAATLEVATGLLMRPDIEVGSVVNGAFVPWDMLPWNAAERIQGEIGALPGFLADQGRYVFRRKTS
jgi:hypothetical protein